MTSLNPSTIRRLQKLPQVSSVWEGDRRSLTLSNEGAIASDAVGDCILWVDGTDAMIRAMDMVTTDVGLEAVARTLLKAFEHPHGGGEPMRPTKIVVRNREIQFFLRGVLQELNIAVEHVSDLPLINEIFRGLQSSLASQMMESEQPYGNELDALAEILWDDAPWNMLSEEKIIAIHLNRPDVETFYVSVLGMLGVEYGVLMYRTPESLKQFRQRVLTAKHSPEALEEAFLQQDCLFLTFEQASEYDVVDTEMDGDPLDMGDRLDPTFGNLHPLEGMRPYLYEEEAISAVLALEALHQFVQQHRRQLNRDVFPALQSSYKIPNPDNPKNKVTIRVETLPDLTDELAEMTDAIATDDLPALMIPQGPVLNDDLVPENSMYSIGSVPWDLLERMRPSVKFYQPADRSIPTKADGFPVILIQTSRPKALTMIEDLKASGGLESILFSAGEDPFSDVGYDLGILQTKDGEFHIFGEFGESDPVHVNARKKWDQRCKKTKGCCGLVIAMGLTGASRGNPTLKDMMALFEVKATSADVLGMGTLQRMPKLGFPH